VKGKLSRVAVRLETSFRWWSYRVLQLLVSDETYISWQFRKKIGRRPNLLSPVTFNEKLQWLKLHYRTDLVTQCADKYHVRDFVNNRVGPKILNELYAVYESVDDIDLACLPDSFVLKVTHGCGQNIICRNKSELNWDRTAGLLEAWLHNNYYYYGREWSYKNIRPRIICEKYLIQDKTGLRDYKFFCFDGVIGYVECHANRFGPHTIQNFDIAWNRMDFQNGMHEKPKTDLERPAAWNQMVEYAAVLSKGFPFVRVDLYCIEQQIIFGEMTFYPASGYYRYYPEEYNLVWGDMLTLPTVNATSFFAE
jgi:hypothetical protein